MSLKQLKVINNVLALQKDISQISLDKENFSYIFEFSNGWEDKFLSSHPDKICFKHIIYSNFFKAPFEREGDPFYSPGFIISSIEFKNVTELDITLEKLGMKNGNISNYLGAENFLHFHFEGNINGNIICMGIDSDLFNIKKGLYEYCHVSIPYKKSIHNTI